MKNYIFLTSPLISSEKPLSPEEAVKLSMVAQAFQNSNFLLSAQIVSPATNAVDGFPRKDRLTWLTFEKMLAGYPHLKTLSRVCCLVFRVEMASVCEPKQGLQLETRPSPLVLQQSLNLLGASFPFITPDSKTCTHSWSRYDRINTFYFFIK